MAALRVLSAGPLTTVQDLGRVGFERFGVPQSGAMDPFALMAGNRLAGNPQGAAGLEFVLEGPTLQAEADCLIAVTGCGYRPIVQGRRVGAWMAAVVWRGETVRLVTEGTPGWGYLSVAGGIDAAEVMGSRSTYARGGFGGYHGRALKDGDRLLIGDTEVKPSARAGRWLPPEKRPRYANPVSIPVILGPQLDRFTDAAVQTFLTSEYIVSATSDRMGYRLSGPQLAHRSGADLISEPLAWGAVQVPADGQPLIMMADRNTAGGYPKIATVAMAGIPLLAQAMPGSGRVRFEAVTVEEGQRRWREMMEAVEASG